MKNAQLEVIVRPIRFTDRFSQMLEFLSVLGFSTHVSRADRWTTMLGGSGQVALHHAATSGPQHAETGLAFEVADADALAAHVTRLGITDTEIYDEAYGRVLRIRGAGDAELLIDERPSDFYGYEREEPKPDTRVTSMPILSGPPTGPLDQLLSAADFTLLDEGDDARWRAWRGAGGGLVARRAARTNMPVGVVQLGVRTSEPLSAVADRLLASGYPTVAQSAEFGAELWVTDPDSATVVVQHDAGERASSPSGQTGRTS